MLLLCHSRLHACMLLSRIWRSQVKLTMTTLTQEWGKLRQNSDQTRIFNKIKSTGNKKLIALTGVLQLHLNYSNANNIISKKERMHEVIINTERKTTIQRETNRLRRSASERWTSGTAYRRTDIQCCCMLCSIHFRSQGRAGRSEFQS